MCFLIALDRVMCNVCEQCACQSHAVAGMKLCQAMATATKMQFSQAKNETDFKESHVQRKPAIGHCGLCGLHVP